MGDPATPSRPAPSVQGEGDTPRAHGAPVLQAVLRTQVDDFIVEEVDAFAPSGAGEHLLLRVQKRGLTTPAAARRIAQWAGVAESAIGYAGLKDRHAIATQRFSVWLPKKVAPDVAALQAEDLRVLEHAWHARKLPRGALAGNRFRLTLRDVHGEHDAIEARLHAIAARGVPNAFGEQRFGRYGDNIDQALAMFDGRRFKREERTVLLSAARSALFNRVLALRVETASWDRPLPGEVFMLDGSHSVFGPVPLEHTIATRIAAFDIHPTGPLWGRGTLRSEADAAVLEAGAIADAQSIRLREGLERAGLKQERRSLRLVVRALTWDWVQADALQLGFVLEPGSYATTVLTQLGDVVDVQRT